MQDLTVEPLIEARWGQGIPWNKYCPADDNNQRALVGCVAVSMAQLMRKWNWPEKGMGSNTYTPTNYPAYGELSARFDTLYPWADMHPINATDASALILYHAGIATYMNYGPNESGANTSVYAPQALKDNFKYYKGMQVREKERFLEKDWFRMLRQELINSRPLIYFGSNPDGGTGHAFNIDGFHSQNYFHFNWGWNGAGNGYFRLENMALGGGNFTKGQAAIFWIQPENIPMHDRPGLVQTLPGDSYVQILWDDLVINDFSHYNIYRNGELIGNSVENRFKDEGLENGKTYTYQISASYVGNGEGESALTEELEATPEPALNLPFQIGFESIPDSWEFSNGLDGFRWGSAADLGIPGNNGHLMAIRSDQSAPGEQVMDYLTAPSLDLRGIQHVAVSLDYTFKQKPGVDYLFLMYRRYDNGLWYPISRLDSTGELGDWKTVYFYFPPEAKYGPIQLGFYYNDFRGQGFGAAIDNIKIWKIDEPPVPEFSLTEEIICQQESITVFDESIGNIYSWFWDFGDGAEPRFSSDSGPHVVKYTTAGYKNLSLLLNHLDPNKKNNHLWVHPEPFAGFAVETSGLLANFQDTSKNAVYFWWDFGDGIQSTEQNPQHKYREFELFTVSQVVWNENCDPDTLRYELDFRINSSNRLPNDMGTFLVYPVPAREIVYLENTNPNAEPLSISIISQNGCILFQEEHPDDNIIKLNTNTLRPGLYYILIKNSQQITRKKIIIE